MVIERGICAVNNDLKVGGSDEGNKGCRAVRDVG